MELGKREKLLLGGLTVQILAVGLFVFLCTQAIRGLSYQRAQHLELKGRMQSCQQQVAEYSPDFAALRARISVWKGKLSVPEILPILEGKLDEISKDQFHFQGLRIRTSTVPEETIDIPLAGDQMLQIDLYPMVLRGYASTAEVAGLLNYLAQFDLLPVAHLSRMELGVTGSEESSPVEVKLEWMIAISETTESDPKALLRVPDLPKPIPVKGWDREPFLSPVPDRRDGDQFGVKSGIPDS
jgi:hypothetical protein